MDGKPVGKNKVVVALGALLFCCLLALPAQADFEKTKIAVLDFALQGEDHETTDMGAIVAEWFITALVKEGRFDVVERALLQKIIAEQKLGITGVIDESSAAELGQVLGVKVIISGSVSKLQDILEINARIIDVETGSIIVAENVKSSSSTSLQNLIVQMSQIIIKNFPLEGYIVERAGENVTIDLGKMAGVRDGMEFITFKEGNIIKHPKTGEVLDVEQVMTGTIKITTVRGKISHGLITSEEPGNLIKYGQQVKSGAGELQPLVKHGSQRSKKYVQHRPTVFSQDDLLRKLHSKNLRDKKFVGKYVSRKGASPEVFDAIEEELLMLFPVRTRDGHHIDASAWLCTALGSSGDIKYKQTLVRVARKAPSRKLRGYAKKALKANKRAMRSRR